MEGAAGGLASQPSQRQRHGARARSAGDGRWQQGVQRIGEVDLVQLNTNQMNL